MPRTFTKNTIVTFISQGFQLIFAIGASIIIARGLGPTGKGIYALAILLPTTLIVFVNLGVAQASIFYIGKKKYSPKEILGANMFFSIIISIFTIIAGLIIVLFFGNKIFPGVGKEYLLLALSLVPFQLFLNFTASILLGLQKIKKYNIIQLVYNFIFLILVTVFILGLKFGIKTAIIAQISSSAIGCFIMFIQTKKETKGIRIILTRNIIKDFFSYGIKCYFTNIIGFLHYRIDMLILNLFLNPTFVGFYSIAVGLAERIWVVSSSAGTVLFPKVSSEKDPKKLKEFTPMVFRSILLIVILIAILLLFLGRWIIVLFYSEKFLSSVLPFQILLIGTVAISGVGILSNDITGRGKPIINSYVAIFSVILNIILNLILIPKLGIVGSAFATAFSYVFTLFFTIIMYSRISGNKIKDIILFQKQDIIFYRGIFKHVIKKIKNFSTRK